MRARETGMSFRETISEDEAVVSLLGQEGLTEAFLLERHMDYTDTVFERLGLSGGADRETKTSDERMTKVTGK